MTEANSSACAYCGSRFEHVGGKPRKCCSKRCYFQDYNKTGLRDWQCAQCQVTFSSERKKKYCSQQCNGTAQRRKQGIKTWDQYVDNQRQKSKFNFNCEHCGKAFYRLPGGHNIENGSRARWCSMRCKKDATVIRQEENRVPPFSKYFARFCMDCEKPFSARAEKVSLCKECVKCRHLALHPYVPVVRPPCEQCGGTITGKGKKYCSQKCYRLSPSFKDGRASARKAGKLRRRGAVVTNFNPLDVFERDGWRCQICGVSTPKSRRGKQYHNSPELDHIRPISKGGEHSISNTQCACRACNGFKSNVLVVGQIGLFSADAIAKAGVRKRGVKKWEKAASA